VILTGTPSPNGLLDLWSQIYLLDRGERLGRFLTTYREEYFSPDARNGAIIYSYRLKKDADKRIHDKIGDICISMKAEDYLDMPEVILNDIMVEFPEDLQTKYDQFEEDLILKVLEGEEISALNAAALSNKLLQFANGAVYDEDHNFHEIHSLKLDAAEEIVESAGGKPVLIAWTYRHDLHRLKERLKGYHPRELLTDKDITDWNDGKIQVLLMHPASGGHGLNLQYGGNIIVWFGQTWSLELYEQLNARLNRQGQTRAFILNRIIASKTMDQEVIKSLERKTKTQDGLMEAIKFKIQKYFSK
jgi:SNF2 family DNA or RNA helicase